MKIVGKIVLCLSVVSCDVALSDFFPLGAYGCRQPHQADICGMNTIHFWWYSRDNTDELLRQAESLGMNVILGRAREQGEVSILDISGGRRLVFKVALAGAPDGSAKQVRDGEALDNSAWVLAGKRPIRIHGTFDRGRNSQFFRASQKYYAQFRLRTQRSTKKPVLCTLFVQATSGHFRRTIGKRALTGRDFARSGTYDTFAVAFTIPENNAGEVNYAIAYPGNRDSLYCDRITVLDSISYYLLTGRYDDYMTRVARYYNNSPALFRHYLWDEPTPDQYWAIGEVNRHLKYLNSDKSGVQALSRADKIDEYIRIVDPSEIVIDNYPLYGRTHYYGRTPVDSGVVFQRRLDNMCRLLDEIQSAAAASGKHFWFMPQSFGHIVTDAAFTWSPAWNDGIPYKREGWFREPTPRELQCMVWLALAHGAKGIIYYRHQSYTESYNLAEDYGYYRDHHWIAGMTDPTGNIKRPLWYTVAELNREIAKVNHLLLELQFDKAFKARDTATEDCSIVAVNDTLLHFGVFRDTQHEYFIIVNRHCLPTDHVRAEITLRFPHAVRLQDCVTKKITNPLKTARHDKYTFPIDLFPGQGKMFKILPYM